jgi:pimeloyl-ACP methyl ester carboxylesterase
MQQDLDPVCRYITIDECQYCYRQSGQGPGIVLLHGMAETSKIFWRGFIPYFENQYTVVAMDLRGFGDSDKPKRGYEPEAQAQVVACLVEELGLDKPVLLGHSLGGIIATKFAILFPDKLHRLIIYDSPVGGGFLQNLGLVAKMPAKGVILMGILLIPLVGRLFFKLRTIETTRYLLESLRLFCDRSSYTDEIVRESMRNSYEAITQNAWHAVVLENLFKDLSRIRVPTLILRGEHDALVSQSWMERVNARIPNSQLVVIKGACHMSLNEQPDQFNQAVFQFLSTVE